MIKKIKKEDKTPIIESQLLKASTAILEFIEKSSNGINPKRSLIEEDKNINIEVVYQRSPTERSLLPILLEIPHAFRQDAEICIFTKDPQSTYKQMIKDSKINAKVIAIDKLKNKYKQYESRIKLAGSYDLFLCDIAVVKSLPKLLGSSFFSSKRLIPIEFPSEEKTKILAKNIIQARDSTHYYRSFGPKCSIKIGNPSLTAQQITDNTLTALTQFIHAVPRGWKNILSLSLSIHGMPSLPFYVTFPEGSMFKRKFEEVEKVSDDEEENNIIIEDDKELAEENKNFQSESEEDDNNSDISNDSENNINDDVDDLSSFSEEPTPKKAPAKKNQPKKTPQSLPKPKKSVQSTPTSSNKKPKLDTKKVSASVTKPSKSTNTNTTTTSNKKQSSSPFNAPAKSKLRSVVAGSNNKKPRANNKKPNKK